MLLNEWINSIDNRDLCISYPHDCSWWVIASKIALHLENDVSIIAKDTNSMCLNNGYGIGNKDEVPKEILSITDYTISPSEVFSCKSKYIIYGDVTCLPRKLESIKDKRIIVLFSWGTEPELLVRLSHFLMISYKDETYDTRIRYNNITVITHHEHAVIISYYKNSHASDMICSFYYPIDICIQALTGWSVEQEINSKALNLIEDYRPFFDAQSFSYRSPKIYELYASIANSPNEKHVVITSYSGNYGCHMISKVLELMGIDTTVLSYQDVDDSFIIMENFESKTCGVLITNYAPISEVKNIANIHVVDTYNVKLVKGWLKYSYSKELMSSSIMNLSIYAVCSDQSHEAQRAKELLSEIKACSNFMEQFKKSIVLDRNMNIKDSGGVKLRSSPSHSSPVNSAAALSISKRT